MAITVREPEKKINWFAIGVTLFLIVFFAVLFIALFFATPPLVEKALPKEVQSAVQLSQIELHPEAVLENPVYRSLRQLIPDTVIGSVKRTNPFSRP